MPTDYVHALQPLLDRFGNDDTLTIILFTLDESTYQPRTGAAGRALSVFAWARRGGFMTAPKA